MALFIDNKRIPQICAALLLVVLLTMPFSALSAKASTSSISEVDYSGSYSDFQTLVSGNPSLDLDLFLYTIGFIVSLTLISRNVKIDLPSGSGYLAKLKAYGEYGCNQLWSSVKNFAYGVYQYCNNNNIYSWTDLSTHFTITGLAPLLLKISYTIGDLVYSPSSVGEAAITVGGVAGSSATNPMNFSIRTPSAAYDAALSNVGVIPGSFIGTNYNSQHGIYEGYCNYNITNLTSNSYLVIQTYVSFGSTYYVGALFDRSGDLFTRYNAQGTKLYTSYVGSFSSSTVSLSNSSYFLFQAQLSRISVPDLNAFYTYILSLGIKGIYFVNSTAASFGLSDLIEVVGPTESVDATVPLDGNFITTPTSETIEMDLSTPVYDPTADAATNVSAITGESIGTLTIDSAIEATGTFPSAPTYNLPSLDPIWKYPRYLFSTARDFFVFCKECLDCATVGEGGLSWIFYGGFVFMLCGGVLSKFLQ